MTDELKPIRRENLRRWFQDKTLPAKDKSLISQLIRGKASFGEKVSRRLEADYGMGKMYLDTPQNITNNSQTGTINVGGDNVNGNVTIHEINRYNTILDKEYEQEANFSHDILLKSMPLLDIDDAAHAILYPNDVQEKIKNANEKVASFISNQHSTLGVKVSDNSIKSVTDNHIVSGDIAIVEPAIIPRNNDIVLVALEARTSRKRGIFAKLKIDLANNRFLINDDFIEPIPMPTGAVICGIVIEVKRRLVDIDVVHSRYEQNWDIWESEEK